MTPPTPGPVRAAALDAVLPSLACPVCGAPLRRDTGSVRCGRGHRHDVARQGYASLAAGSPMRGDTAPMVAARSALLRSGAFDAVLAAVLRAVPEDADGLLADVAGGPGWYAAHVLDARDRARGVVLDVSPPAARAAAGAHPRLAAATADVWRRLPLRDGAVAVLLDVFGPRHGAEFARVLAPGGVAVVVTPAAAHLAELRPFGTLGVDPGKERRTAARLDPLVPATGEDVVQRVLLTPAAAADAVLMGPSGHHLDPAAVRTATAAAGDLHATVAVRVQVWRPVSPSASRSR